MSGYPRPRNVPPTPLAELASRAGLAAPVIPPGETSSATFGASGSASTADHASAGGETRICGVTNVSGSARPGDLYAALPGANHHGAQFAGDAVGRGAVAVLTDPRGAALIAESATAAARVPLLVVEDPRAVLGGLADLVYGQPTKRLTVLGITGTAGKTSVVNLIDSGLRAAGQVAGSIGTVQTRLGDLVVPSARTTPEAPDLHALFAVALERGVGTVAMEVSSHALALGRVGGVRFAVGGFTNLGRDHLDFHADVEDYFAAKARLFDGRCAAEVINLDDAAGRRLAEDRPGAITYSARGNRAATWYATDVVGHGYGQRFVAHGPVGALPAGVALPGLHNVANALLATAVLVAAGVDPQTAAAGVAAGTAGPGRLQRVEAPGGVIGVVDYAHKPEAVVEVLAALREMAGKHRVISVIGAGGDRDRGKRSLLGKAAAAGSDLVVVTDDNPRTEDPAQIRAQVVAGALEQGGAQVVEVGDRRAAIAAAVEAAAEGDVVALLGKGHERYQEIAGARLPFDDVVELAGALRSGGTA